MKSTRAKYLVRNIKKGGVSFLAVAVIAAVSIAIFHGFQSSANAILQRADRYFTENNLETLEISCANGITPEDLQAIAAWESVDAVEGGYTDSVQLDTGGERILVQARSLTDTINQPVVVEGSLPTAENEAAIEAYLAQQEGIAVGDTITLAQDGCLTGDTFTVTGIVNLPVYCCVSLFDVRGTAEAGLGSNEYFVCLPQDAFDPAYYSDCYTTAYVDSSTLDGVYYFSDEYAAGEQDYLETLEPLAQERAQLRYDQLKGEVDTDLTDARQELQDAQAEIAEKEQELEKALNGADIDKQLDNLDLQATRLQIQKQQELVDKYTSESIGTEITANVSGTISAINVSAGKETTPGQAMAVIEVVDRGYTIKIPVTNEQAQQVKVGDTAEVSNYYWGNSVTATLEGITADPDKPGQGRLLVFRVTGDIEAGANISLSIGQRSANYDAIIPKSALREDTNGSFVLVVTSKSTPLGNRYTATRVDVQVLAEDDTNAAVSGLSSNNDYVITTSSKPLEAGELVRMVDGA